MKYIEQHDKVVRQVVNDYSQSDKIAGIILCSQSISTASKDKMRFKFLMLTSTRDHILAEKQYIANDALVKLTFFYAFTNMASMLRLHRDVLEMMYSGELVLYKNPLVYLLKMHVNRICSKGPPAMSDRLKYMKRKRFCSLLDDANGLLSGEKEDYVYSILNVMNRFFVEAIPVYYYLRRWPITSPGNYMKELREWDKHLYKLCEDFIKTNDISAKHEAMKKMVSHVLKEVGGHIPQEWEWPIPEPGEQSIVLENAIRELRDSLV